MTYSKEILVGLSLTILLLNLRKIGCRGLFYQHSKPPHRPLYLFRDTNNGYTDIKINVIPILKYNMLLLGYDL